MRRLKPTRHLRGLFAINESPTRWPIALKAALAMVIPLTIGILIGHESWGLIGSMGGFTVLYGPNQPARFRLRLMAAVAVGFTVCATVGAVTAPWPVVSIAFLVAMAAVGVFACAALQIGPPGAFFFTLVAGACTNAAEHGVPTPLIVGSIATAAVIAIGIGMADLIRDPYGPERQAIRKAAAAVGQLDELSVTDDSDAAEETRRKAAVALHQAWTMFHDAGRRARSVAAAELEQQLFDVQAAYVGHHTRRGAALAGVVNSRSMASLTAEARAVLEDDRYAELREAHLGRPPAAYLVRTALRWPTVELLVALKTTVGTALAATAAIWVGQGHPYWAVAFCVLMVHQPGTRVAQTLRTVQRFAGTVVGLGVFALVQLLHPHGWLLVVIIGTFQFVIEWVITRNYGIAVIFMTPLALLLASAGPSGAHGVGAVVSDRIVDTAICCLAALVAIWFVGNSRTMLRILQAQLVADAEALSSVLRDRADGDTSTRAVARRQFLHYELVSTTGLLTLARGDNPEETAPWAGVVATLRELGMLVLGMCWYPSRIGEALTYAEARDRVRRVFATLRGTDPAAASAELDRVHRKLLTAGIQPDD